MKDPARDQVFRDHLPLVRRISKRLFRSRCCNGLELDDLVAFGNMGLIRAVDRFDPAKGVRFKVFAALLIKGAIRDGVRQESNWFGRRLAGVVTVVHLEDLAPDGWEDWVGELDEQGLPTQTIWCGQPMYQSTPDGDTGIHARLAHEVRRLPERQRQLIHLHYYQAEKLADAARVMKVQRSSASKLREKALQRLHRALAKSGSLKAVQSKPVTGDRNQVRSCASGPTGRFETTRRTRGLDELLADIRTAA